GYATQKNSASEKATGDWILSLDADESLEPELADEISNQSRAASVGFWMPRKNFFLGRWIKHGGFWPDPKLRLFRRGAARFEDRPVHEDAKLEGPAGRLSGTLIHHSYPTLSDYIAHMNRYSSLGAEMAAAKRHRGCSRRNIVR